MTTDTTLLRSEVSRLIASRDFEGMKRLLAPWLPIDVAPHLAELPLAVLAVLFRNSSKELGAAVFSYLENDRKHKLLKALPQPLVATLLNELPPDDRTAFLDDLPLELGLQLLSLLSPEERKVSQDLLAYPEHSVGRMMTLDFIAVRPEWNVHEVLEYIRLHGIDRETLNEVYVTDEAGRLLDDIRLRRFLLADRDTPVRALMDGNSDTLAPTDDRETALEVFQKYDRVALPVCSPDQRLIGIVTADDMLDVAEEEATEDIQKLGGSEALEEPYTSIPLMKMLQKRAGWLVVLLLGEMLTATAMGFFEEEITKAVVLALFVPLIISAGGNAGSQAATLVIRAMALGEITLERWWLVMRRELATGLMLGVILGVIGFLRISLWAQFSGIYGEHYLLVAVTVGLSLMGIVAWGSLTGSMLPLVLKRLGFDPATSSAPFVATLVDVTGLLLYFSLAYFILRGTLL